MAKITFLQNIEWEFWGTMSIAAVLESHGHECEVLIGDDKDIIKDLKRANSDLVAFSCMSIQYEWIAEISKGIKSVFPKVTIIVGGAHPTVFPDIILNPFIDIVCRGEGEYAMLELADRIDEGKDITSIKGLWVKKEGMIFKNEIRAQIEDINELPFANREIYKNHTFFKKDPAAHFVVNRGCIYNCTYCFLPTYRNLYPNDGKYSILRYRNIKHVIAEIAYVLNKYNKKSIAFHDSVFTGNREWLASFLNEYRRKIYVPFGCNTTVDLINDGVVRCLKEANCLRVNFGLESGLWTMRSKLLNKRFTNEQVERVAVILKKHKLGFSTNCMHCLPGETLSDALETIRMNQRIKPVTVASFIYQPLLGTKLAEYALRKGFIDKQNFLNMAERGVFPLVSILKQKDNLKIENLCRFSYLAIKYPLLLPLIKFLIRLAPNSFFDRIYLLFFTSNLSSHRIPNSLWRRFFFIIKGLLGLNDEEICKGFWCDAHIIKRAKQWRRENKWKLRNF